MENIENEIKVLKGRSHNAVANEVEKIKQKIKKREGLN